MTFSVFGSKPKDSIFLPETPLSVRLNCQAGQIALSEDEFLGNTMEIAIIGVNRLFGSLGKTLDTEWLQLFYLPAPSCKLLPANTVCVSYIKSRSLTAFGQTITRLMEHGEPALGIFIISFVSHTNGLGQPYKSVKFEWRARKGAPEQKQLEQIIHFMDSRPALIDTDGTRDMLPMPSRQLKEAPVQPELVAA